MNQQQLAQQLARLMDEWPNAKWDDPERPGGIMDAYAEQLLPLAASRVEAAITMLIREGGDFPPTGGKVYRRVVELAIDAPPWAEVHRAIRRLNATGYHQIGEPDPSRRAAYREVRDSLPTLVQQFVRTVGGGYLYEALDSGGNGEARIKAQWLEFVSDRVEQGTLVGLPSAGMERIERANRDMASLGEVLGTELPALEAGGEA